VRPMKKILRPLLFIRNNLEMTITHDDTHSSYPNEMKNNELKALLNKNSAQTLKKLVEQFKIDESTTFRHE